MLRKRPSASTLAIAWVMLFFAVITWRWSWNEGPAIIRSDAEGYYAYLRAAFIDHDLGHEKPNGTYLHETPEGTLNKYFAGEAVMLLPFFLGGHAWAHISGAATDGLSTPYMRAVGIAGLFYTLLGLLAFRALLRRMGIAERIIAATLLALGFGTQLVQYACIQPGWSHIYSFCAIAVFLLLTSRLANGSGARWLVAWGAVFGLILLIRPVNGLVLLAVPIVLGDGTRPFVRWLLANWKWSLLAMVACAAVVSIQSLLWHVQVGSFVAYGYKGEGFYWDRPEIVQVLIGVRRGLFLWTPVLLLPTLCVLLLWKHDRTRSIAAIIYWVANTYVISAWWIWYYGSGWGARVYIDHYPVLVLPMALVLSRWSEAAGRRWLLRGACAFLVLASAFTMAQFYQYNHRIFHPECMDSRRYAYTFLRFDDAHRDRVGGIYRIAPYNPNELDTLLHEKWDAEGTWSHWWGRRLRMEGAPSGNHVVACDLVDGFGPSFVLHASELPKGRAFYLAIGFERYVEHVDDTRSVLGVTVLEDTAGTQSFYEPFAMEPLPPKARTWEHVEYRIAIPPATEGEDLKFYFWNEQSTGRFRLDDLDVTLMAVRPY